MVEFVASVTWAVTAGAFAKAGDAGGRAGTDAYYDSRALVVRKLGKELPCKRVDLRTLKLATC